MLPLSIVLGLTFAPVTPIATTNATSEDAGLASGLFNTSQQVGRALGLAVLATLVRRSDVANVSPEATA